MRCLSSSWRNCRCAKAKRRSENAGAIGPIGSFRDIGGRAAAGRFSTCSSSSQVPAWPGGVPAPDSRLSRAPGPVAGRRGVYRRATAWPASAHPGVRSSPDHRASTAWRTARSQRSRFRDASGTGRSSTRMGRIRSRPSASHRPCRCSPAPYAATCSHWRRPQNAALDRRHRSRCACRKRRCGSPWGRRFIVCRLHRPGAGDENPLEQFQQKWEPDLRPELRPSKEIEHFR